MCCFVFLFITWGNLICTFTSHALSEVHWPPLLSLFPSSNRNYRLSLETGPSRCLLCLTLSLWTLFSGLPGPNVLGARGVCPGRLPLLCGMGRARMREPQGLLHGPVLWTRSFPGRHRNLQL